MAKSGMSAAVLPVPCATAYKLSTAVCQGTALNSSQAAGEGTGVTAAEFPGLDTESTAAEGVLLVLLAAVANCKRTDST